MFIHTDKVLQAARHLMQITILPEADMAHWPHAPECVWWGWRSRWLWTAGCVAVQRGCPYRRTRRTGRDPTATAHLSLTPATTQVDTTLVLHGVTAQRTAATHVTDTCNNTGQHHLSAAWSNIAEDSRSMHVTDTCNNTGQHHLSAAWSNDTEDSCSTPVTDICNNTGQHHTNVA